MDNLLVILAITHREVLVGLHWKVKTILLNMSEGVKYTWIGVGFLVDRVYTILQRQAQITNTIVNVSMRWSSS